MNQGSAREEERDQRERNRRGQPWIYDMFVQLTIHCRSSTLQSASEDDEGDDPSGIHCDLLCV
jgi:hypothetical protein